MEIKEALNAFVSTFGRDENDYGEVHFNNNDYTDTNDLDLLYKHLSFEKMLTVGGELYIDLYSKSQLDKVQEGWLFVKEGDELVLDNDRWSKEWIVFGARHGDAIYFDKTSGQIYGSVNKSSFYKLADSLALFFTILAKGMKLEEDKYDMEACDDDEESLPEFKEEIKLLLGKNPTDFMSFFFE